MGNLLTCRPPAASSTVFLPDSKARPLKIPVSSTAADLMLEHPRHFVAELTGGRKFPLPADHMLEAKKAYVLVPMAAGKVPARSLSLSNGSPVAMDPPPELLLQRQHSLKAWKPSLRTIEERSMERKMPHWLF
ncbi:hypothetical protein KSP40_PGU007769 [Platanthera guangdongensis]|uniref:Uncharacterized protein n=1 Tax=Platanthera guangdongensis TaxID=2320717 RepID=A0ABR2MAD0_9ASPA